MSSNSNLFEPVKTIKNKIVNWWQKDVYGVDDPPPMQRIIVTSVEFAATIGIMYFFEKGTKLFEKLPPEHKKKPKFLFF